MPAMGMKREQGDCQQMLFALPAQALAAPATVNKSRRSMPVPPVSATLRRGDDRLSLVHGVVCNMQLFAGGVDLGGTLTVVNPTLTQPGSATLVVTTGSTVNNGPYLFRRLSTGWGRLILTI